MWTKNLKTVYGLLIVSNEQEIKNAFKWAVTEQSSCYRNLVFEKGNNIILPTFRTIKVYKIL